jgi:2-amino-4-hydroxy-6-hydroxymethyldihydropteridine diphosphokinase
MAIESDKRNINCYLSLGTNLGNKLKNFETAVNYILAKIGRVKKVSSVYETKAWGNLSLFDFYNIVIEVETNLNPLELLRNCKLIENEMGRKQRVSRDYENRVIDIDILVYENIELNEAELIIPHKELKNRRFVLEPLNEIASELNLDSYGNSVLGLLMECKDSSKVLKLSGLNVSINR